MNISTSTISTVKNRISNDPQKIHGHQQDKLQTIKFIKSQSNLKLQQLVCSKILANPTNSTSLKNSFLLAINSIQEAINHKGSYSLSSISMQKPYGSEYDKNFFQELIGTYKEDLENICVHTTKGIRKDIKLSFWGTNYTNSAQTLKNWIDSPILNIDCLDDSLNNPTQLKKAKVLYSDGTVYEGMFKNDKKSGTGKITFTDGTVYEGMFENDKKSGTGKLTFLDGTVYEGMFENDKKIGKGILTKGNVIIESQWINNALSNQLKLSLLNPCTATSDIINRGKYELKSKEGHLYRGSINKDLQPDGKGILFLLSGNFSGNILKGKWENGKITGEGYLKTKTHWYRGVWEENNILRISTEEILNDNAEIRKYNDNSQYSISFEKCLKQEEITGWKNGNPLIERKDIKWNTLEGEIIFKSDVKYTGRLNQELNPLIRKENRVLNETDQNPVAIEYANGNLDFPKSEIAYNGQLDKNLVPNGYGCVTFNYNSLKSFRGIWRDGVLELDFDTLTSTQKNLINNLHKKIY